MGTSHDHRCTAACRTAPDRVETVMNERNPRPSPAWPGFTPRRRDSYVARPVSGRTSAGGGGEVRPSQKRSAGGGSMPRTLTLTSWYPPHHFGGYELSCFDVMNRFVERGHEVRVLCGD